MIAFRTMPRADSVAFTIAGQRAQLSREQVIRKLRSASPTEVQEHFVEVNGVVYPLKQAFHLATGFDLLDFHTTQARTVFRRLGFKVNRKEALSARPSRGSE